MRNFNPNKARGHDSSSNSNGIRMLKIRNRSICNLLVIIFRSFLEKRKVLLSMKKSQCGSLKKRARAENLPFLHCLFQTKCLTVCPGISPKMV